MRNQPKLGDLRDSNRKYTSREVDAIILGNMINKAHFQINKTFRNPEDNGPAVFTTFVNARDSRRVAVFTTANDHATSSTKEKAVTGNFTLDEALKFYKESMKRNIQLYPNHENIELIIPLCFCDKDTKHLGHLKIIKDGDKFVARIIEPTIQTNFNSREMEKLLKDHFGKNIKIERLNFDHELGAEGINEGPYTAQNIDIDSRSTKTNIELFRSSNESAQSLRNEQYETFIKFKSYLPPDVRIELAKASSKFVPGTTTTSTKSFGVEQETDLREETRALEKKQTAESQSALDELQMTVADSELFDDSSDEEPQSASSLTSSREDVSKKDIRTMSSAQITNDAHLEKLDHIKADLLDEKRFPKHTKTHDEILQIIVKASLNPSTAETALLQIKQKANDAVVVAEGGFISKSKKLPKDQLKEKEEWQKIANSITTHLGHYTSVPAATREKTSYSPPPPSQKGGTQPK